MKKYALLVLFIVALLAMSACSNKDDITNVPNSNDLGQNMTAGQIHTEFLKTLYAKGDFAKCDKSSQIGSAKEAANRILVKYGLDEMTDAEIYATLQQGRDMAQQDPVQLIRNILNDDEYTWWDRFASQAHIDDANEVYEEHCQIYGQPAKDSILAQLLDVSLSSANFWGEYRKNDVPKYKNPYVPYEETTKSWRGILRFVVAVAVDGSSGALVSGGGPVASGVVGGLASGGADDLIFGDDD